MYACLFHINMYYIMFLTFPKIGKYIEMYLYKGSTCLNQADFDYPFGACLIQVGLYIWHCVMVLRYK